MVRKRYIAVIVVWMMLLLVSCDASIHEYPSQGNDEIEVRVVLKTDGVSNVSCDIYNVVQPKPAMTSEMLRVLFYAPENGRMVAQCFISQKMLTPEGDELIYGRTYLPPGDYIMLAYNFDTETVRVEHENAISEINAFTPEVSGNLDALPGGNVAGRVFRQPEHLLVARQHIRIVEDSRLQVIEAEARTVVDTYYLQIRVRGLKYASKAKATLSGMSPSNRFGVNERSTDDAKILFDLLGGMDPHIEDENQDVLCTLFNTFGKIETETSNLTVRFEVITHDGKQCVKTLNIDSVFLTEDARERHWLLIDEVLNIPEPQHLEGGFVPGVTDWDEIHENIEL